MPGVLDNSGFHTGAYNYIQAHLNDISELPPPGREWTWHDLPDVLHRHFERLKADGAIHIVGETEAGHKLFETDGRAWEVLEECAEHRQDLLCGHSGIENLGGGVYTCGAAHCDHTYTRDTMEKLLDNSGAV